MEFRMLWFDQGRGIAFSLSPEGKYGEKITETLPEYDNRPDVRFQCLREKERKNTRMYSLK